MGEKPNSKTKKIAGARSGVPQSAKATASSSTGKTPSSTSLLKGSTDLSLLPKPALYLEGSSGKIIDCNALACSLYETSRKELLATSIIELTVPAEQEVARQWLRSARIQSKELHQSGKKGADLQ